MKTTILAPLALLSVLAISTSTIAADAPTCINTLAGVEAMLTEMGVSFMRVPAEGVQEFVDKVVEPIIGAELEGVTNVLLADLNGQPVAGVELGGCLTDPIPLAGKPATNI